jgi:hypothetical protein
VVTPIFHDAIFVPPHFKVSMTQGAYWCQNGGAIRAVPAKDRVANTEHEPLAFEC